MDRVCLPKAERDKIITALKSGELKIMDLYALKSKERNELLKKYVGEELASMVNSRFEQAMRSKQKNAMVNWVKSVTTAKDPIRRDMLKKVERIKDSLTPDEEQGFLSDLAETKLGMAVTEEEAQTILALKKTVDELKAQIPEDSPIRSKERMAYGFAVDKFKNYIGDLKLKAETPTWAERARLQNFGSNLVDFAGFTKSLIATLDDSFIGRQGIKTLLRGDYKIWFDTFKKSLEVFGKELIAEAPKGFFKDRSDAIMSTIRADILSRPNALNGKYAAAKNGYGLGQFHEEAFPTSIPSKIPFLGRLFKASETAFTASALKMRVELADKLIEQAEKNGIDMLKESEASGLGNLVTSMTGRGELTTFAASGKEINALMFAPRFLKANFNTITAHTFDKSMSPYARRVAANATLRIVTSIGALLTVADIINPGSVEWDPRSSNFGKITIGGNRYDITGGMNGLVTLAARLGLIPIHNGEFGLWSKSASTGMVTDLTEGAFGQQTAMDVFENFFEGKLSPAAGALRDIWKGQKFSGEKPDIINTISGLTVPISLQFLNEELKKGNDDILIAMLAESFGFSATDTTMRGSGKKWQELEEKEGVKEMNKALNIVTKNFNKRVEELEKTKQWDKMSNSEKAEKLSQIKDQETTRVLNMYGIK